MIRAVPKPPPRAPAARKPVRKVNRERRKAEFARTYHSDKRVEFVRNLPCAECGVPGWCDNAHTSNEGKSRKGHYTTIAPLCGDFAWTPLLGCHTRYDRHLAPFDNEAERERIKAAAVETENRWLQHKAGA